MRVTVIHNPKAGKGAVSRATLESILADHGYHVRYQSTAGRWKSVLQEPADLIVAAGGDGTVRKVATQLAKTSGPRVPFAIIPLGTANNVATALGIEGDAETLIRCWSAARPVGLDLGRATSPHTTRAFVEGAGGGIVADAIARGRDEIEPAAPSVETADRMAIELLARVLDEARPEFWEIDTDGADRSGDYFGVEAMNVGLVGHNVPLVRGSSLCDGMLDLIVLGEPERAALRRYLDARLRGRGSRPLAIEGHRFARARLRPPAGRLFRVDDKSRRWSSARRAPLLSIEVQPAAVSLIGVCA
jgi:diacylglycerol kinase family enzyme